MRIILFFFISLLVLFDIPKLVFKQYYEQEENISSFKRRAVDGVDGSLVSCECFGILG